MKRKCSSSIKKYLFYRDNTLIQQLLFVPVEKKKLFLKETIILTKKNVIIYTLLQKYRG